MMDELVIANKVEKVYRIGSVKLRALKEIDLIIIRGDFSAITGPSGSGKTTLLNMIGCLDKPSGGEIIISGKNINKLHDDELSQLRAKKIGFIFQFFNLISVLNIAQNIEYPLLINGLPRKQAKKMALEIIEEVRLTSFINHRPNQLSGGQQQRVAIARALVKQPEIVLADEPTGNLDSKTGREIIDLMFQMAEKLKTTFIFSTHDKVLIKQCKKQIRLMDGGIQNEI